MTAVWVADRSLDTSVKRRRRGAIHSTGTLLERITFVLGICALRIVLDVAYLLVISPRFAYAGLVTDVSALKVIESYIITLLLASMVPPRPIRPSDILIVLLLIKPILPQLSLYGLMDADRQYTYMVALSFVVVNVVRHLRIRRPRALRFGRELVLWSTVGAVLITLGVVLSRDGLRYFNLDLRKVYDFRSEVGVAVLGGWMAYLSTWVFKVLNPAMISWSLHVRRYSLVGLFTVLQVVFFAISSHKSVLFYVPLIVGAFVLFRMRRPMHMVVVALIFVMLATGAWALFGGDLMPASLLIRRVMFVPSYLNFAYHEFFSSHQFIYLTSTGLRGLIGAPYPYELPPPRLISMYLQGHSDTWMNTGYLATSYMHAGYLGMLVFSAIVGVLLGMVDAVTRGALPLWLSTALVLIPFSTLFTSADLPTALLTHGIGLALLVLWLLGSRGDPRNGMNRLSDGHLQVPHRS